MAAKRKISIYVYHKTIIINNREKDDKYLNITL